MKGNNVKANGNLTIEHQATEEAAKQSISSKKNVNVKLESLKEIERQQKIQIDQSKEYLKKQEQILEQKKAEVRHTALSMLQDKNRDTRVRLEQSVDFALRSMPWWERIFFGRVVKRALLITEMLDAETLRINVREMKKAMDSEMPGLVGDVPEETPANDSAPVDTMEAIEQEEAKGEVKGEELTGQPQA